MCFYLCLFKSATLLFLVENTENWLPGVGQSSWEIQTCCAVIVLLICLSVSLPSCWSLCFCVKGTLFVPCAPGKALATSHSAARGPQRADYSSWLLYLLFPCSPVYWWASPTLSGDLILLLYSPSICNSPALPTISLCYNTEFLLCLLKTKSVVPQFELRVFLNLFFFNISHNL